ncbi:MAG: hypothetical protein V9G20_18165 [Candidatus Promineifilaceae bacterium]
MHKHVDQVIPGHNKKGQTGREGKTDHIRDGAPFGQELRLVSRVACLQKEGDKPVEHRPDDADAQKAEAK